MILTNYQVYSMYEALVQLKQMNLDLPIKIGFVLLKNLKTIEPVYLSLEEVKRDLLIKNSELVEDNNVVINKDKIEYVNQQLKELSAMTIEIELTQFSLADLDSFSFPLELIDKIFPLLKE